MKKQSKAEEALRRQLLGIEQDIAAQKTAILTAQTRLDTFKQMRDRIEREIERLFDARKRASEERKPGEA